MCHLFSTNWDQPFSALGFRCCQGTLRQLHFSKVLRPAPTSLSQTVISEWLQGLILEVSSHGFMGMYLLNPIPELIPICKKGPLAYCNLWVTQYFVSEHRNTKHISVRHSLGFFILHLKGIPVFLFEFCFISVHEVIDNQRSKRTKKNVENQYMTSERNITIGGACRYEALSSVSLPNARVGYGFYFFRRFLLEHV